jgi:hypothetical protein
VARGATLSTDGTAHTGSIHVLDAADWMLPGGSPSRSPSRAPGLLGRHGHAVVERARRHDVGAASFVT